ncbi:D-alanyl-D-alanine carboxypeptidase/D-alanyl-D-alanine-endopeptidase [Frankia sp. CNm7]|uniref:D-alanyl-D-alanine carboxypeptidase/D-alanyl-D-alanine-endopeptidase n=1 Tax=Frankia nepalensis TaxID=1836974 RepID=A0A937RUU4_9ACTN|nr:D-alanyl-D-alanine carboxypeptidase/D-alanyl-D-alanine-endopeptidase [Frankia nepalensis]MBL7496266.1 D-alanyl-D-alanine carboxypeptidase/D-alanyl-D-alanine-endopeptidase [Frankia nepalensis]MBL7513842.1 D-alanyl-D-alanine carboxypeptidase/D-alanyl-D-alanine-endopeptidase [Frankia nepalensis]MBL7517580.1 D-alanyl-D-alanine carboxypeptidase/D-alanyl-D-alanine-endopeptidase [Frankia nepalensis]MBL7633729.1 D-alanyl-D-alanine carboxypeptidase/D-alanyl-D-alanine-endopeptidase [Frankia nepalensis
MTGAPAGGLTALVGALLAGSLTVSPGPGQGDAPTSTVPRATAAALPGLQPDSPVPDPAAVAAKLAGPLSSPLLGGPAALVVDALSGKVLFDARSSVPTPPASTLKTAVAAAALRAFGPTTRLTTRVVYLPPTGGAASPPQAVRPGGTLWLVGAGDPTLTAATDPTGYPASASARLSDLAEQVHAAGITSVDQVVGDGTLFSGPATAPGWRDSYVTDGNVTPVSALEVDGGRSRPGATGARAAQPDAAAAAAFATALRAAGVDVGSVSTGAADPAAKPVAKADSPPIPVLVERMLTDSDNDLAECLGRLVAKARGLPTTFAGATTAVRQALTELGVDTAGMSLSDVSGLSTTNLIMPRTLIAILRAATSASHPELRTLLTGMPVAGFSGTLGDRYGDADTAVGAGDVRAKTGSLRIVTSLAGELVDADGRLLLFGFFAPVEDTGAAKASLDRVAAALASCGCPPAGAASAAGAAGPPTAKADPPAPG